MITDPANTPADDLTLEQATIRDNVSDDQVVVAVPDKDPAPKTEEVKTEDAKVDPRAARMEALAEKSHDRAQDELTQSAEAMAPVAEKAEVAPAAPVDRMMKIKVRGEIVEMPESEVIARAQKVDAADSYLTEARTLLEDAKKTARPTAAEPAPTPAKVEKIDRIAQAIEQIQIGGDPAEIRDMLDKEIDERVARGARQVAAQDDFQSRLTNFDAEVDRSYDEFSKEHADVAKDPVASNVVVSLAGGMEGQLIGQFLEDPNTPQHVKSAFAQAGITAEGVKRYSPHDAHALFKDMHLKGYPLPSAGAVIKAAGMTVAQRFSTATPRSEAPAADPKPVVVDRTQRKADIQQPERASIPRAQNGQPAPKSEPERAQTAREELRGSRRAGSRA